MSRLEDAARAAYEVAPRLLPLEPNAEHHTAVPWHALTEAERTDWLLRAAAIMAVLEGE